MNEPPVSRRERWKQRARALKHELTALYFACRDSRTPLVARILAVIVVGYAFSPIDLIPDPIPILGYLDDAILLPIGIALVLRMIPPEVMVDSRVKASALQARPQSKVAAVVIVAIWLALAYGGYLIVRPFVEKF